jgi:hypothetical protein
MDIGCVALDVKIYTCISPRQLGLSADEVDSDWEYCLGEKVETRIWRRDR